MGTPEGALKAAARRINVPYAEYRRRLAGGHRAWHLRDAFCVDRSRGDGLKATCRAFDREVYVVSYVPVPLAERRPCGPPPVPRRDGDKRQARRRINVLVRTGRIPAPNKLLCADCSHEWSVGERRHEYDHYLGYAAEHHEDVEAVCTTCHREREAARVKNQH